MDFIEKLKSVLPEEIDFEDIYNLAPADLWKSDPRKAGVIALERADCFDKDRYRNKYIDIAISQNDPIKHFVYFGIDEGRKFFLKSILISVIIPIYNTEKYLDKCLESVISQSLKDIEIICINDGSTDNSLGILKKYSQHDKRILIISQKNKGLAVSRNIGMSKSKGKYIGFIDSDDYIEKDFYLKAYKQAEKYDADIVRTQTILVYEKYRLNEYNNKSIIDKFNNNKLLNKNEHSVTVWNAIYKLDFLRNNNIDYFDNIIHEDVPFTARVSYYANKIAPSDAIYYYRKNIKNQLSTHSKKSYSNFLVSNKIALEFISSHIYKEDDDQLLAFKRCIDRYEWVFKLYSGFDFFTQSVRYNHFKIAKHFLQSFPYMKKFIKKYNRSIYKYILDDNFNSFTNIIINNTVKVEDIIVSLTSYPKRIKTINKTIESIINQSIKPCRIYLFLSDSEFKNRYYDLPEYIVNLVNQNSLNIEWYKNIGPYKKIIPALKKFKDKIIITADDDLIYDYNWIKNLYESYLLDKNCIHAHRVHRIIMKDNKILPYKYWINSYDRPSTSFLNFATGGAGKLYPPNCLNKEVFNEKKFMSISKNTDDVWMWAMEVLSGIKIKLVKNHISTLNYTDGTQECGLWETVNKYGNNDINISKIDKEYRITEKIID